MPSPTKRDLIRRCWTQILDVQQTHKLQWYQWHNRSDAVGVVNHSIDRCWSTESMRCISHLPQNHMRTCCNGLTWNFLPSNQLPRNVTQECHQLQTGMAFMTNIFCSYRRIHQTSINRSYVCCRSRLRSMLKHWIHVVHFDIFSWIKDNLLQWTSKNFFSPFKPVAKKSDSRMPLTTKRVN